jgi:hypothetical protein
MRRYGKRDTLVALAKFAGHLAMLGGVRPPNQKKNLTQKQCVEAYGGTHRCTIFYGGLQRDVRYHLLAQSDRFSTGRPLVHHSHANASCLFLFQI